MMISYRKHTGVGMLRRPPSSRYVAVAAALALLTVASVALAGAPLKGVDVKLGRNPGGSAASRTTNAEGVADFGVLAKGDYYVVIILPPSPTVSGANRVASPAGAGVIKITGVKGGPLTSQVAAPANARSGTAGTESPQIPFQADGIARVSVTVASP